jgi:membrane protease YdiL (CAAX protease family)
MDEPNQPISEAPVNYQSDADQNQPDPGSPMSGLLALIIAIVFAAGTIFWQNLPESTHYAAIGEDLPGLVISTEASAPGRFGQFDLAARMFIRGRTMLAGNEESVMQQFVLAYTPEDQVRAIIMSGEFEGADEALNRLETTRLELSSRLADIESAEDPEVIEGDGFVLEELDDSGVTQMSRLGIVFTELDALQSIYTNGSESVDDPMRDQLVARYGVLGQAALAYGLDDDDPMREPIVTGFVGIALLLFFAMMVVVLAAIAGFVLLIFGIVNIASGKMMFRFKAPAPGGSVFLETYGLFVAGFAVLSIGLFVVSTKFNPALGALSLPLQWILLLVPLWALARGMKVGAWKEGIGFHRGEGLFKEIGCGFIAYLASIPIFMVGIVITLIVVLVQSAMAQSSGQAPEVVENPIFELLSGANPLLIVLVFTLATVWAPLAEELVFRGALYRHMRGRLHWVFAALFSALLFAYMHSYGPLMVAPLVALGFMFAFMREWRGSIIAPITAHFIHNATLVGFMIVFISLLKDPVLS